MPLLLACPKKVTVIVAVEDQNEADESNPLLAITLKIISVCAFLVMATVIKLAGQLPVGQIAFYRSFWAIWPIVIYLLITQQHKGVLKTNHLKSHIWRGAIGVFAMGLGFYGLTRIPLPDAIALSYSRPLITIVLGAVILGEVVRRYRWGAVMVGFVGVMIISWPKLQILRGVGGFENQEALGVIATLLQAIVASFAFVLVRQLVKTERTPTIVLYFSITASAFALMTLPFGWEPLSWNQIGFLVAAGVFGGLGQILLTQSYRYAETSIIAPFEYTSVIFSLAIGVWLFSEAPSWSTIIGSLIVVGSGIFIIFRERSLGIKRSAERRSANMKGL